MKIQLWSVGKLDDDYVKDGIQDFTKRINQYFQTKWTLIPPPKNAASLLEKDLKKAEAVLLINLFKKDDFIILLDEKGKYISSPELAQLIQKLANDSSNKRIIFLIGGAFGVDEIIVKRANFIWSLSKLVFPHMLVRLILSEQVYRACSILRNEKYHHS